MKLIDIIEAKISRKEMKDVALFADRLRANR